MVQHGKGKIIRSAAIVLNSIALVFFCWLAVNEIVEGGNAAFVFELTIAVFVLVNVLSQTFSLIAFLSPAGDGRAGMNVKKNVAILLNLVNLGWLIILSGKTMTFFGDFSAGRFVGTVLFAAVPIFTLWTLYRVPGGTWFTRETAKKPAVAVSAGIALLLMYFAVLGQVETAKSFSSRGLDRFQKGDYRQAIQDYSKSVELDPENGQVYRIRALAYEKLGDYKSAIEDYSKAIAMKPDDGRAYRGRGFSYGKLGDHNKAVEDYSRAIDLNPKDAEAYRGRGLAYEQLGDSKWSAEDYDTAKKMPPPKPGASYY